MLQRRKVTRRLPEKEGQKGVTNALFKFLEKLVLVIFLGLSFKCGMEALSETFAKAVVKAYQCQDAHTYRLIQPPMPSASPRS